MEKRLVRSKSDRVIAGVAGGMGQYSGVDSTVLRLIWIVLGLFHLGLILVIYLALVILLPEEGETAEPLADRLKNVAEETARTIEQTVNHHGRQSRSGPLLGLILIILGCLFFAMQLVPNLKAWAVLWPILLIIIGFLFIKERR